MRLNLGCGRDVRAGWVNIDCVPLPGVDHVVDFDGKPVFPFGDDSVTWSEGSHVIEHLASPLPFMAELWRVTEAGGRAVFRCPYGSSDDADEDPTHVRRMFPRSWEYFAQPMYWRADYGYTGDWQPVRVTLTLHPEFGECELAELRSLIQHQRNVVAEMTCELRCVKPRRAADLALQEPFELRLQRTHA